ncbi:hypothetical protein, partial [Caldisericum sp.]|uniref:hypothetical protein n=1 Tax=Caldisericum sp. TaxID=2499687 RepID=UPI003D0ECE8A
NFPKRRRFLLLEGVKVPLRTTPEKRRFLTSFEMTGCVIPKPKARNLLSFRGVLRGWCFAPSKWLSFRRL